ncbi:MAG: ATP-binding protein [Planctomycetota bacterium]|nr:ATP-binding protein [Planctomycetota bacterium]
MSEAFCAVDTDWRLVYVNGQAEKITRRSRTDLLGRIFWEAFPEIAGTLFFEKYHLKTTEGVNVRMDFLCPTLNVWLEVNTVSSPRGLAFFFRDITEQRKSTDDLKRLSEQLFCEQAYVDNLLRHIPAGVMICEAPGGRILYENERIEKNFGHRIIPPNSIEEYANWQGFHSDDRPYEAHEWPLARSILTGEVVNGEEISIKRSDGKRMILLVASAPIRNKAGEILAGMVIDHDITDRKQRADELQNLVLSEQEARRTAEAANRSKDEFIAVLSHELRTPLTPVVMTLSALETDMSLPEAMRDDVMMIRRNVELEMKLIDDLLDVTRITNGKLRMEMRPANIVTLLQNVLEILRSDFNTKGQKLTCKFDALETVVSGDSARLHQVFWNLLKNAIKFSPEAGQICIRTSNPSPGILSVEICDSGEGIDATAMPRIFAAFEQADHGVTRKFGGLGLGLTISKAIMDLHGGTIRAQSDGKGHGSRFTLEFHTTAAVERLVERITGTLQEKKPTNVSRVLLVDDHRDTLRVLRRLLESLGYQVATAMSVNAALSYLATNAIDVLVSDIGLPDASGHDLMRQLRQVQNVPGVAVSGFGSEADVQNSYDAGFCAHLTKPIDLHVLHAAIQRAVATESLVASGT